MNCKNCNESLDPRWKVCPICQQSIVQKSDEHSATVNRLTLKGQNSNAYKLLLLLSKAKSSLTVDAIAGFLQIKKAEAEAAIDQIREVLYEDPLTPDLEGYQLFHESLREWLKSYYSHECHQMEVDMVDKCLNYSEIGNVDICVYSLTNIADHIYDLQDYDKMWLVFKDRKYVDCQITTFKHYQQSYRAYKKAIQLFSESDNQNDEHDAKLCYLAISLRELTKEIKEQLDATFEKIKSRNLDDEKQLDEILSGFDHLNKRDFFLCILIVLWYEAILRGESWKNEQKKILLKHIEQVLIARFSKSSELSDFNTGLSETFSDWFAGFLISKYGDNEIKFVTKYLQHHEPEKISQEELSAILGVTKGYKLSSVMKEIGNTNDIKKRLLLISELALLFAHRGMPNEAFEIFLLSVKSTWSEKTTKNLLLDQIDDYNLIPYIWKNACINKSYSEIIYSLTNINKFYYEDVVTGIAMALHSAKKYKDYNTLIRKTKRKKNSFRELKVLIKLLENYHFDQHDNHLLTKVQKVFYDAFKHGNPDKYSFDELISIFIVKILRSNIKERHNILFRILSTIDNPPEKRKSKTMVFLARILDKLYWKTNNSKIRSKVWKLEKTINPESIDPYRFVSNKLWLSFIVENLKNESDEWQSIHGLILSILLGKNERNDNYLDGKLFYLEYIRNQKETFKAEQDQLKKNLYESHLNSSIGHFLIFDDFTKLLFNQDELDEMYSDIESYDELGRLRLRYLSTYLTIHLLSNVKNPNVRDKLIEKILENHFFPSKSTLMMLHSEKSDKQDIINKFKYNADDFFGGFSDLSSRLDDMEEDAKKYELLFSRLIEARVFQSIGQKEHAEEVLSNVIPKIIKLPTQHPDRFGNLNIKPDIPFLLLLNGRFKELQTISDKANDYLIRSYSFLALAKLEAQKSNALAAFNYCKSAVNLVGDLKKGDYNSLSIHAFICIMSALVMLRLKEYQRAVYFLNNSLDDNSSYRRGRLFHNSKPEGIYIMMMNYMYSQLREQGCFFEIIHDSYKTIKPGLQYKCLSLCALFMSADKENEKRLIGICTDLLQRAETDDSRMWIFEAYKEITDTFDQQNALPVQRKHFKAFDFMDTSSMEFIGLFLKSKLKSGDNEIIIKLNEYLSGWSLFESFKHPLPFVSGVEINDEINTAAADIIAESLQAYLDTNSKMELKNAISEGKKISVSKSPVIDDLNIAYLCANEDEVVKAAKEAINKSDVIFLMASIPELVREGFSEEIGKKMVVDLLRKWGKYSKLPGFKATS